MLPKLLDKIKSFQYHIFLAVCLVLISFISFNLGKISSNEDGEIKVTQDANIYSAIQTDSPSMDSTGSPRASSGPSPKATAKPLDMRVVVSKNSDKYHYSWCASWKRITQTNQLWFENEEAAIRAGYTLAGNCSK